MRKRNVVAILAALGTLMFASTASAQEFYEPEGWGEEEGPTTDFGIGLSVGGALNGFTDNEVNDFTEVGGGWEGRLTVGTRSIIGFEAAYIGTANEVDALGLDNDSILLANGVEGLARLNLLGFTGLGNDAALGIQPFVAAGAGYKHYEVVNEDFNTSAIDGEGDVLEIPLEGGLSYMSNGFLIEARGSFKPVVEESNMFGNEAPLHNWGATLRVGTEF